MTSETVPVEVGAPTAKLGTDLLGLLGWLVVCFMAPALAVSAGPDQWYASLNKPSWNPPSWLFGPVWTLLYTLMAIAAWLVWRRGGFARHAGVLVCFLVQLALNAAWSPIFFGMHQPGWAFAEIVLLWLAIVTTIIAFWGVHRLAAAMLIPYLLWVSFASALNLTLWRMNS